MRPMDRDERQDAFVHFHSNDIHAYKQRHNYTTGYGRDASKNMASHQSYAP